MCWSTKKGLSCVFKRLGFNSQKLASFIFVISTGWLDTNPRAGRPGFTNWYALFFWNLVLGVLNFNASCACQHLQITISADEGPEDIYLPSKGSG